MVSFGVNYGYVMYDFFESNHSSLDVLLDELD